jgi:hypothetical protein
MRKWQVSNACFLVVALGKVFRYNVPEREHQTIHGLGHQAACKGWGQGGLPYLAGRLVLSCCATFSLISKVLSHTIFE